MGNLYTSYITFSINGSSRPWNFLSIRAQLTEAQQEVQNISRPGVDGAAFRMLGKRPSVLELLTIEPFDNRAARLPVQLAQYMLMAGNVITVNDDFGTRFTDCFVMKVERVDTKPLLASVGGPVSKPSLLLYFRWTIVPSKVPRKASAPGGKDTSDSGNFV